jgi:hypothetical protein
VSIQKIEATDYLFSDGNFKKKLRNKRLALAPQDFFEIISDCLANEFPPLLPGESYRP